jgi:hypothetical protein
MVWGGRPFLRLRFVELFEELNLRRGEKSIGNFLSCRLYKRPHFSEELAFSHSKHHLNINLDGIELSPRHGVDRMPQPSAQAKCLPIEHVDVPQSPALSRTILNDLSKSSPSNG